MAFAASALTMRSVAAQKTTPSAKAANEHRAISGQAANRAGEAFRDCDKCPEMVILQPGAFQMGASANEARIVKYVIWSVPQHTVKIAYPFAVGRYEVTVDEFDAYVKETGAKVGGICAIRLMETGKFALKYVGTPHPGNDKNKNGPYVVYITDGSYAQPGLPVTGRQPAVCVSRNEMTGYLTWLSSKTKRHYRLPTEAEWEYAYRAGTDTISFWGDNFAKACDYANFGDRRSGYQAGMAAPCAEKIRPDWTAEVGSYKPNPWGLHDMAGNAQEAVEDCLHHSYNGAPTDGSPWAEKNCLLFVARGGDYELTHFSMRASERLIFGYTPDDTGDVQGKDAAFNGRSNVMGFRVAVSLDETAWDHHP
jgi:formylglycine-generating enzyme required for sulfatase activity